VSMSPSLWKHTLAQEGASREEVARVLTEAADHLERVGLHKGGLFPPAQRMPRSALPCCGWGAIEVVKGTGERAHGAAYLAEEALSLAVGARDTPTTPHLGHFPNWNDEPKTSQAAVLMLMRSTADAIQTRSGVFA